MKIRQGLKEDVPRALELIRELARFVKAPGMVENTEEKMTEDGFGKNPAYGFFVAEENGQVIGMALYYYRYSTWKGKCLYLEDLIVHQPHRGKGAGKMLFDRIVRKARDEKLGSVVWQVLAWNDPAMAFYRKLQADFDRELVTCSLSREQIERYA